jgi:5-methylcytosine-specific restriction endonuclease McrA
MNEPSQPEDFWRAVILYGLNSATYKIALAQCLVQYGRGDQNDIPVEQLAGDFFGVYKERLTSGRPQLAQPNRWTIMERVVVQERTGMLSRDEAIAYVAREAFNDVLPRFHTVSDRSLPFTFYVFDGKRLRLDDAVFDLFANGNHQDLVEETNARWDLLEAAFTMRREHWALSNNVREMYLQNGYRRTNVTHLRPILNGYQHNRCFYCDDVMIDGEVHVDHMIPRQVIQHDEVWNLVLAHRFCNLQKNDNLPDRRYLEKLLERNEHFIASNHPIAYSDKSWPPIPISRGQSFQ